MKKERADVMLVEQGLADTREKAKRSIMAGIVLADGQRVDKPGMKLSEETVLSIKGEVLPYVSRGGLKLERALQLFPLTLEGRTMIDIGASTGGFTDCALQNGAARVYALDVGTNQLAWKIRSDDRVIVMEQTNFRYCTEDNFSFGRPTFAVMDVSFISVRLLLPVLKRILAEGSDAVILIKPQFEAGRHEVGRKGIIRDEKVHTRVLEETAAAASQEGFGLLGAAPSPIKGGGGNTEFLFWLRSGAESTVTKEELQQTAAAARADDGLE
ncbi:TlyA family RNA methyltransferase [Alkalicoccus chagannorensis]|uniref:TlyA family RNA methyltransferase n=1 Tax=Alkalicoccus chagannorensis TaxID=427072 RepID=UPI00041A04E4|nr:TlyA family RNA methyltransferase [Alkalicoccus chagannorensis]